MPYALREALATLRRTPLLALLSVIAISFSLLTIGLFGLVAFNIQRSIERVEERVEVVAYLEDGTPDEQIELARREIAALPAVLEIGYVSKTQALAEAREMEEFRDVFSDLDANPLPASFEIRLQPEARTPRAVQRVAKQVSAYPFVEEASFGREWLDTVFLLRRILAGAAMIIGGAFAAVAAIIIATAVRISVFARRDEISIMRLVGATNGFIRSPFLIEGLVTGLLGGILAVLLTYGAFLFVGATLIPIEWIPPEWVLAGVAVGTGFGFVSSAAAVHRHLGGV